MNPLCLRLASTDAEHRFALELTQLNMEQITKRHWGEWRSDILSAHYPAWTNFLILEGENRIGYVGIEAREDSLSLHNIQLQDQYRRRGIGHWAIIEIEHRFQDYRFMEGHVFKDNPAVSFFKNQGFEIAGEDEHCWVLRKPLRQR